MLPLVFPLASTACGARLLMVSASARWARALLLSAARRRVTWPVASVWVGAWSSASAPCRSVSPFQGSSRSAAGSRGRTSIKQPCDRPLLCQRATPVELLSLVCHSASSARLGAELEKSVQRVHASPEPCNNRTEARQRRNHACGFRAQILKAKLQRGESLRTAARAARFEEHGTHWPWRRPPTKLWAS